MDIMIDISQMNSDDESPNNEDKGVRYVYTHRSGKVELHPDNLKCLESSPEDPDSQKKYLSDSIVNFYSAYLLNECVSKRNADRIHVFDSIFYDHLGQIFPQDLEKDIDVAKWYRASKWYDDANIFKKDFLIFPICYEEHWFTIIVCYPGKARTIGTDIVKPHDASTESIPEDDRGDPLPGMIILDSLRLKQQKASMVLRDFLDFAWRDEMKPIKSFSHHSMPDYFPALPKQNNTYDCGIFMLLFLKAFVKQPDEFYRLARRNDRESQSDLRVKVSMFVGETPRQDILKLVKKLCKEEQRPSKKSSASTNKSQ